MQKRTTAAGSASSLPRPSVGHMFDHIAPTYDLLNHLLSLGRDRSWRRKAAGQINGGPAPKVIDLATGTGDLLICLLHQQVDVAEAVGLDVSAKMLAICRDKLRRRRLLERVELVHADASATPFPENAFDVATMAFGIRNTPDATETLREMHRILRPGGTAVILEFSLPKSRVARRVYVPYLRVIVPLIGRLVSADPHAYRYLNESIEAFYEPEEFLRLMRRVGFLHVSRVALTFGVALIYTGVKGPSAG